ncbi:MAG: hypothetical protein NC409_05610 [Clostridium sp.]|nr:hypothetical protein [Clostridium sp.]
MIYKCHNCGGNVIYDPQRKRMYCAHCEGMDSEEPVSGGSVAQCANCGAPLTVRAFQSAGKCEHCGCYQIFEERVSGQFTPHLILPFTVSRQETERRLQSEFGKRTFAPSSFLSRATLKKMEGMYVPFFMYDYHVNYDWSGKGTKVRVWTSGDTEYTETSHYHIRRSMEADFSRVPVDASDQMDDAKMDLVEPYDYGALTNFQMKYMSGFFAEMYNQGAAQLEPRAHRKAERDAEELMRQTIAGYSTVTPEYRNLSVNQRAVDYALMPVWVYEYTYGGESCPFYVNGQTGKVIGKMPVSKPKMIGYTASVFGFVLIIGQLVRMIMGLV